MKKKLIIVLAAVLIIVFAFAAVKVISFRKEGANIAFETAVIKRGKISNTVTATGTLEAIQTVAVGTQVSGVIKKIYVDFNSEVKKGQLLAQIDETPLLAQLQQSKATVDDAEAELEFQTATYTRNKTLFEKKLISQADFDQVTYNYNKAKATLLNAKAVYNRNKINLDYATITSPINGVILNRAVDQGQTVAASFNTPTLFSIANDLTQMRVEASVDEADIGQVKRGQRVEFTVDAYPDLKFPGQITEVRLQPVITSNVVTYTVIIGAPNPDKKLMPGMTASTIIFVQEANDEFLIPMKAVKFSPDEELLKAYQASHQDIKEGDNFSASGRTKFKPGLDTKSDSTGSDSTGDVNSMRVWVKRENRIFPVPIEVDISDGISYGIKAGLQEGDSVILSMSQSTTGTKAHQASARSPFMPTPPRRR